ncbi:MULTISPECIES: hypothetical protein [unclassified Pseudomonas]|uniref:hypothetical protein n=1 Tax=unclassified Pseudomonas TaxID=196821 RepID=UPI002115C6E5|nr:MULTISPECIES: hypothetical protein [unclassified Pseudomonas]
MGKSLAAGVKAQARHQRGLVTENVGTDLGRFSQGQQELFDHSSGFGEFETQSSRAGIKQGPCEGLFGKNPLDFKMKTH